MLKIAFFAEDLDLEKKVSLNRWAGIMNVGALFRDYIMNVDFKAIKTDYKFYCPQCGKVV